jgi:tetratricopeptide (TPR) repeat protein
LALLATLLGLHSLGNFRALAVYPTPAAPPPQHLPDLEVALAKAKASLSRSPGQSRLHGKVGSLLLAKGERLLEQNEEEAARQIYPEAVEHFRKALTANPVDAATHREITLALERSGDPAQADFFADRGARLAPTHADLQFRLGLFYLECRAFRMTEDGISLDMEGLDKAFACFRRAGEGDLNYFDRALALVESSLPGMEDFSLLVPPTLEGRLRFARFLARQGRWSRVAEIEEEGIAAGRDGAESRIRAGEARLREGLTDMGFSHFREAFDRWRLTPPQIKRIRAAILAAKKADAGTGFLLSLKSLQPEETLPVAKTLGFLFLALQEYPSAEEYLYKAAVGGADSEAYFSLALLAEKAGDLYNAERNVKQAIRGHRDCPEYHHKLGQILEKSGNLSAAVQEYETASRLAPGNAAWRKDLERLEKRWKEGK